MIHEKIREGGGGGWDTDIIFDIYTHQIAAQQVSEERPLGRSTYRHIDLLYTGLFHSGYYTLNLTSNHPEELCMLPLLYFKA